MAEFKYVVRFKDGEVISCKGVSQRSGTDFLSIRDESKGETVSICLADVKHMKETEIKDE